MTEEEIRVFVHLARAHDATAWRSKWESGNLIGINDPTPYGYGRAEEMGCRIRFSTSHPENSVALLCRMICRAVLGFDYLHARRNSASIAEADVVWTHTESGFLAVALHVLLTRTRDQRPVVIGQAVWLYDYWGRLPWFHRALFRRLIREITVLTVHSPANLTIARQEFPSSRSEIVLFGIPNETGTEPEYFPENPATLVGLGNDRHRDWATLVGAVSAMPEVQLTILSATAPARLARGVDNVTITTVSTNQEMHETVGSATLMVIPLRPNYHASGITAIQEAALRGVPLVVSDTGGLRAYFGDDAVTYVPPGDAEAMRDAIARLLDDPARRREQARRARVRMEELGCDLYIRRHVELSKELLAARRANRVATAGRRSSDE